MTPHHLLKKLTLYLEKIYFQILGCLNVNIRMIHDPIQNNKKNNYIKNIKKDQD